MIAENGNTYRRFKSRHVIGDVFHTPLLESIVSASNKDIGRRGLDRFDGALEGRRTSVLTPEAGAMDVRDQRHHDSIQVFMQTRQRDACLYYL